MKRLKSRSMVPPGGFTFVEEETGLKINETHFNTVVKKLISHRAYKGHGQLDPNVVAKEVENYLCDRVPENYIM